MMLNDRSRDPAPPPANGGFPPGPAIGFDDPRRRVARLLQLIGAGEGHQRRAAIGTVATNLLIGGVGLLSGLLAARLLGPQGRGELAAIQTWPVILAMLTSAGLPEALTFSCATEPERSRESVLTGMAITGCLCAVAGSLGYLAFPYLLTAQSPETMHSARLYLWMLPLVAFTGIPFNVMRGLGQLRRWNIMRCAPGILWTLVVAPAAFTADRRPGTIALRFLILLPAVCVLLLMVMDHHLRGPYRISIDIGRRLLRFGLPCTLTALPQIFVLRLDQLFMAALLPSQALGLYAVGVAWASVLQMIAQGIGTVLFPRIAAAPRREDRLRLLRSALRDAVTVMVVLVPLLLVVTPFLLPWFFGAGFAAAVPVAAILVVAGGVAGFNGVIEEALRGLGQPRAAMRAEIAGLAVTIPALIVLLPRFGVVGAAATSLVAYVVVALVLLRQIVPLVRGGEGQRAMLVVTT
jgi:O-antigen/teichoic acid export membrane protein